MTAMPMTFDGKHNDRNKTSGRRTRPNTVGQKHPDDEPRSRRDTNETPDRVDSAYLRLMADFENYKRHAERRISEAKQEGADELVSKLVPVIADLEKAVAMDSHDAQSMRQGVEMVARKLLALLKSMGYDRIATLGEFLDPKVHEAVARIPAPGTRPGIIVAETSPGFLREGKLIKPAKVVVAGHETSE